MYGWLLFMIKEIVIVRYVIFVLLVIFTKNSTDCANICIQFQFRLPLLAEPAILFSRTYTGETKPLMKFPKENTNISKWLEIKG